MIGRVLPFAIVAASTIFSGCVDEDRVVYVKSVPPPDAAEVVTVAPGPDYVYVRGHSEWNGSHYVWAAGRYLRQPYPRAVWVEAHWQSSPRGCYWQPGHWGAPKEKRPASTTAAPPTIIDESPTPAQANPAAPPVSVPPAPTYLPPPPPTNRPPPPGAASAP
jgi:hypothetical protein